MAKRGPKPKDKPKKNCLVCGTEFKTTPHRKDRNEKHYCSRTCYDSRRKENLKRLKRSTRFYQELLETTPCKCGVKEVYLLQIHHIDGNHKNHYPENLEIVCGNCHVKRHLKLDKGGKLVYHPKSLTDRTLLNTL